MLYGNDLMDKRVAEKKRKTVALQYGKWNVTIITLLQNHYIVRKTTGY